MHAFFWLRLNTGAGEYKALARFFLTVCLARLFFSSFCCAQEILLEIVHFHAGPLSWSNLNLEHRGFVKGAKLENSENPENPEKNSRSRARTTNSTYIEGLNGVVAFTVNG